MPAALVLALGLAASGCSTGPADREAASTVVLEPSAPPLPGDAGAESPTAPATSAVPAGLPTPSGSPTAAPSPRPTTPRPSLSPEQPVDPLTPKPPLESPPPTGRPTCQPSALTVTDADRTYTADAVQALFTVRTTGPDCQLPGSYPQVQVLDAAGASMGAAAQGGFGLPAPGGAPITLSTSTSLSFYVATDRADGCAPAARLAVTFPGTSVPVRAATSLEVCAGALGVGPVQRLGDDE